MGASKAVSREPDAHAVYTAPCPHEVGGREGPQDFVSKILTLFVRAWPSWASLLPNVLLIAPSWGPSFQRRNLGNTN